MKNSKTPIFALLRGAVLGGSMLLLAAGCGETVNCENLCTRTLKCNVSFQPADDPDRAKVAAGERTEQESCVEGCIANEIVTVERATCIDNVPMENALTCQNEMLDCLSALVSEDTNP